MTNALGVNYITRETNIKAKAGNLNHAMNHTSSDLILVLDCDHVPARDILSNTVGWFLKDEKLAFIQTPHFFINPTPIEKNMAIFNDAPSENEMFYRGNHLGLDSWNSSFFCGSAAVLKRKYLEEVGGISGETVTEDCETAFSLHKKGYSSVYISRPMVCGLSPDTFNDFILQRSRWAQGMTQILILNNPLFTKGLKFYQRLCYFNNCFFWFFGMSRFIFYIAPAAFLIMGLKVYFASVNQVLAYAVPHVIATVILMDFFYGKFRWPFFSELFESIQSLFLLPVVFGVLANPRKPTFKVTPKGKSLENDFLSGLALPFFLLCAVLLTAVPMALVKWFKYPLYRDVIAITLVWCLLNLSLAMASFGAFFEKRQ
ncbi:MAG TPA: cellulose synthase catalytic subunit (UDP-forming), partial [Nitrospiraceae bacterium]|nr:cellulose synthase catalytic subunit (UDP-forming) [Nitrospiraceae bacterium]